MLTDSERRLVREALYRFEGRIPHMYLDTVGKVTVGVGHMIPSAASAARLPFLDEQGVPSGRAVIEAEYATVLRQTKGLVATAYRRHTRLHLAPAEIDRLTDQHLKSFERELGLVYRDFNQFPSPVKLALMDMIFNLGMPGLRTAWPRFNRAVRESDWATAATQSNRAGIQPERNDYVRRLFEQAAVAARTEQAA